MRLPLFLALACFSLASNAQAQVTELISKRGSSPASSHSYSPAVSGDGKFVAFKSWDATLDLSRSASKSNNFIYLRDRAAGATKLLSVPPAGDPNGPSYLPAISADGKWVAFWSQANNLVADDTNDEEDLFLYSRLDNTLRRISVTSEGAQTGHDSIISHLLNDDGVSLSADGRYIAYDSVAPNVVPGDSGLDWDVFVFDRVTGAVELISRKASGEKGAGSAPVISGDGRYVVFRSNVILTDDAPPLEGKVYLYDRELDTVTFIDRTDGHPAFSANGQVIAYRWDGTLQVYHRQTGTKERADLSSSGAPADAAHNTDKAPGISGDGRYIAFQSLADNLVSNDLGRNTDCFIRDTTAGITRRLSVSLTGQQDTTGWCEDPSISADGYTAVFMSTQYGLISPNGFATADIFAAIAGDDCPDNPQKVSPGVCGCGVADTDSDKDGTLDCQDSCPSNASKTVPGECGCARPDIDTDGDTVLNCNDLCPDDALKTEVGVCGCGQSDSLDSDGDGKVNCQDDCPSNSAKTTAGQCGCAAADIDSDSDGVADCNDGCANDGEKLAAGQCGCGAADTDSDNDGKADCVDGCPSDNLKQAEGVCGCGIKDLDSNGNGIADCNDIVSSAGLKDLLKSTIANVKRLKATGEERTALLQEIATAAAMLKKPVLTPPLTKAQLRYAAKANQALVKLNAASRKKFSPAKKAAQQALNTFVRTLR